MPCLEARVARVFGTAIAPALGSAVTGAMTRSFVGLLRDMRLRLECACAVRAGHASLIAACARSDVAHACRNIALPAPVRGRGLNAMRHGARVSGTRAGK